MKSKAKLQGLHRRYWGFQWTSILSWWSLKDMTYFTNSSNVTSFPSFKDSFVALFRYLLIICRPTCNWYCLVYLLTCVNLSRYAETSRENGFLVNTNVLKSLYFFVLFSVTCSMVYPNFSASPGWCTVPGSPGRPLILAKANIQLEDAALGILQ